MSGATPGFNHEIPASIMTPDLVDTRIGRLEFFDGFPTEETTRTVYEHLDFLRAVEVFLNFIPASSVEAMRRGNVAMGVSAPNQVMILDELMDSNPLFLTGNTDTVYVSGVLDLGKYGPIVVEIPPRCGPGTVNDAFFRFVIDMGGPGPDRGQGGKYLIVPADYDDDVPEGYFVGRSPSSSNWLILRGLLVDGRPDAPRKSFEDGLKIYPLSEAGDPPAMEFISVSGKSFNTVHSNDFDFYNELAEVIAREPVDFLDPELRGLAASIGIRKGQAFAPDPRMRAILDDAAAVGNATARAIGFRTRDPEAYLYDNSAWKAAFVGGDYQWLTDGGTGGRNLDARSMFFYLATVNTPAMAIKMVGLGSQYAFANHDSNGEARCSTAQSPIGCGSPPTFPPRISGPSWFMTRRPAPSCKRRSPSRARTICGIPSSSTLTDPSTCTSAPPAPPRMRRTGRRPSPAKAGSSSSGFTAPSTPGSKRPGAPAKSNPSTQPEAADIWPAHNPGSTVFTVSR
jgi:hypothetical protein